MRSGIPTMLKVGHKLCQLIEKYEDVIFVVTGGNETVQGALDTALAACEALETAIKPYRETGD